MISGIVHHLWLPVGIVVLAVGICVAAFGGGGRRG
jgi:hypothetical protein